MRPSIFWGKKRSQLMFVVIVCLLWAGLPVSAQSARDRRDPVRVKPNGPAAIAPEGMMSPRTAPSNDNFANAQNLGSSLPVSHTTTTFDESTIEVSEPVPACKNSNNSSVWFSFTPSANVLVTVDGFGTQPDDLDVIAAVYTGSSLGSLTSVACNDDFDFDIVYYPFIKAIPMSSGVTYYIQIIELNNFESSAGSSVTVTLRQTPTALNVTVNTTADTVDQTPDDGICADAGGLCSLRAAIMEANRALSGSTITIPAGTYVRSLFENADEGVAREGDLDIKESMTLTGTGAGLTTIDANNFDGVFEIFNGANVNLSGMTIKNGNRAYAGGGVRIDVNATVIIDDVNIMNNTARDGSGIYVRGGTLTLTDSALVNNSTNFIDPGFGSGLAVFYHSGEVNLTAGQATLTNVTISGNIAQRGGGIAVGDISSVTLDFVTLANNQAVDGGGGLYLSNNDEGFGSGSASLARSLIADNSSNSDAAPDCSGTYTRLAKNLIGANNGCNIQANDITGLNPMLRPLELRGPGYTYTHGLEGTSPALDTLSTCGTSGADQRGVARPQNGTCDIGALERDSRLPLPMSLTAPADDAYAANLTSLGTFMWTQSSPDVYGYTLSISNIGVSPAVEVLTVLLRGEAVCSAGVCSYTPSTTLPDNYYEWTVRAAYDGDSAIATARSFQLDLYAGFTNLVRNPSFENKNTDWSRANVTGDSAKCTTDTVIIPTAEGTCAFMFKGSSAENMILRQSIPFSSLGVATNDTFRLTYAYQAGLKTNLVIKLKVVYIPKKFTPSVASFKVANTNSVFESHQSELVLKSEKVKSIKIIINHKSKSGKSYLDRLRLIHIPAS